MTKLKEIRLSKNLSVNDLAELSNLSPDMIRKVEGGRSGISLNNAASISVALNVSIYDIWPVHAQDSKQ